MKPCRAVIEDKEEYLDALTGKVSDVFEGKVSFYRIFVNGFQLIILSYKVGVVLLNLSVILKSHVTKTRYPDLDLNFDVDEFYSESLPLIGHLNELQESAEICLNDIELFVSIAELKN